MTKKMTTMNRDNHETPDSTSSGENNDVISTPPNQSNKNNKFHHFNTFPLNMSRSSYKSTVQVHQNQQPQIQQDVTNKHLEATPPTDLTQHRQLSIPNETLNVSIPGPNTQKTSNTPLSQTPYNYYVSNTNLSSQFQESTNDTSTIPQPNSPPKTISVYNDNPRKTAKEMHEEAKDENKMRVLFAMLIGHTDKHKHFQEKYETLITKPGAVTKIGCPLKYQVCLSRALVLSSFFPRLSFLPRLPIFPLLSIFPLFALFFTSFLHVFITFL